MPELAEYLSSLGVDSRGDLAPAFRLSRGLYVRHIVVPIAGAVDDGSFREDESHAGTGTLCVVVGHLRSRRMVGAAEAPCHSGHCNPRLNLPECGVAVFPEEHD